MVYFSNLPDSVYQEAINNAVEPRIQPGDALAIKITTLNADANILLNSGSLPLNNNNNLNGVSTSSGLPVGASQSATLPNGYIVDKDGNIEYPLLGKIALGGLTIEAARQKIVELAAQTTKEPIVNISVLNFKVTVIGEVAHPGSFIINNNKVNVLEALGLAGDMTPYAIRNDVLVIRERNGIRSIDHLNLNDRKVLNSPYYNLEQNDVVYVQPENKLKAAQADTRYIRLIPIITATISALAIVLSRVL
ncbi:hypothetical protein GCM10027566_06590 [Arachidicoccus ginsenosidivorans]|uniref:polysaccharide biosynthesis/export family protein n=1 Tax=Arachidicoccus ginsenosidivorans TaxID=496057 RepID=UPI001CEF9052|nr:polysaccharide biosynthesis/export family protein [Arachidicoccus ginsenosidivorans]